MQRSCGWGGMRRRVHVLRMQGVGGGLWVWRCTCGKCGGGVGRGAHTQKQKVRVEGFAGVRGA